MWLSLIIFAATLSWLGVWVYRVVAFARESNRRMARMHELQAILCSTSSTAEERRAAVDEMYSMVLIGR